MTEDSKKPDCYGKLDIVFPMGKDGLRQTPQSCMACRLKTDCLRAAVTENKGVTVKREMVDRAYASGNLSFLKRWALKKKLEQKKR